MDFLNSILSLPTSGVPLTTPVEPAAPAVEPDCLMRVRWAEKNGMVLNLELSTAPIGTPNTTEARAQWRRNYIEVLLMREDLVRNPAFGFMIADTTITDGIGIKNRGQDRLGTNYEMLLLAKSIDAKTWHIIDFAGEQYA